MERPQLFATAPLHFACYLPVTMDADSDGNPRANIRADEIVQIMPYIQEIKAVNNTIIQSQNGTSLMQVLITLGYQKNNQIEQKLRRALQRDASTQTN